MFIYLISKSDSNHYKVGVSHNPLFRLAQLQTANSEQLLLIETFKTNFSFKLERFIHKKFASKQTIGEWFILTQEEVSSFKSLCENQEKNFENIKQNNSYVSTLKKW